MTSTGSPPASTFSLPRLTLVLGGARSGKSRLAEQLVVGSARPRIYIATAQPLDDEMQDRIDRHRLDRGPDWTTIESPLDIGAALEKCKPEFTVLVDCATLWLTNALFSGGNLTEMCHQMVDSLCRCAAPVVIVSNEVGWGIVPDNALSRQFADAQGRLNQMIAARADLVVTVMAGLPLVLKGSLPRGLP